MRFLRKNRYALKVFSCFLLINFLSQILYPTVSYALTGGPSQPEVQSFSPVGTSDMVDLFSGDFNYNVPLIDVGGYPINLSYGAGASMDQEASWVGLGWNINPGAITRNVRGLPDDFKGDKIEKEFSKKKMVNVGVTGSASGELFGLKLFGAGGALNLSLGLGISFNNYRGVGMELTATPSLAAGDKAKGLNMGLGLSAGNQSGVGITPNLSYEKEMKDDVGRTKKVTGRIGLPFNSRNGFQALTFGLSANKNRNKVGEIGKKSKLGKHNGGSSISFASPTYTPQLNMPLMNGSATFSATFGSELFGTHVMFNVVGYYSEQRLVSTSADAESFGYLYSHHSNARRDVLLDFNREKDQAYTENLPNLPLAGQTYDIFSVAGQGIGGMYRPFRSDVGIVYDKEEVNYSNDYGTLGVEFGLGNGAHGGVDYSGNFTKTETGKWKSGNGISFLNFKGSSNEDADYEPVYFKQAGEKAAQSDPGFFQNIGNNVAIKPGLFDDHVYSEVIPRVGSSYHLNQGKSKRSHRERRNQAISFLTSKEAKGLGLQKKIKVYGQDSFDVDALGAYKEVDEIERTVFPEHHISEITTYRPDGARYVFGVPAYNHTKVDVTFNVDPNRANCATGMVEYSPGVDNSKNNSLGLDHFYEKETTPSYAHSYLLTSVLSPDYVDIDNVDGPSDGDLGNYTKLNYSVIKNYEWRAPYENNTANYNEGLKTKNSVEVGDDKGSYSYGKKDVWYLHSVETKTHVAEFHLSKREDSYGVNGENGGPNLSHSLRKLDKIVLYSKADKITNKEKATPIKTVHFEYDYSLGSTGILPNNSGNPDIKGYPNQGGKLTLKKVYFTYGKSNKGRLNSYKFFYSAHNPSYDAKSYDRWGSYKPNVSSDCGVLGKPSNAEAPYSIQNKTIADQNASAWNLTAIRMPSGGLIKVHYEADDYAYVQDKRAMQMFEITGTDKFPRQSFPENNNPLMNGNNSSFPVLYFKLKEGDKTFSKEELYEKYLKGIDHLYFKFLVNIGKIGEGKYEYIPGYSSIDGDNYGVALNREGKNYGWVKLKESGVRTKGGGDDVNPISKAAWQFARLYTPEIAYSQPAPEINSFQDFGEDVLIALVGALESIKELFQGFNRKMRNEGHGKEFVKNRSWIRLYTPDGKKIGGGHRVSKITMSDEWKELTGISDYQSYEYGQEYSYTTTKMVLGKEVTISSGVAQYEPMIGNEENPFRQPVEYGDPNKLLVPSTDYYLEEPFGEMFFPGASVGYSKVEVKNLQYQNVTQHGTGKVVHEFFTAKDYPVITRQTPITPNRSKPSTISQILKIRNNDKFTGSQGYVVELNDMHGKQKGQWVYAEGKEDPISGKKFKYKSASLKRLSNNALVASKDGQTIRSATIGIDYDIAVDLRESYTKTVSGGMRGNLDAFLAAIFPIAIPVVLPALSQETTQFRSAVITKVVNRYALLEETIAYDLGAQVSTKNLVYDEETGEVLLTQTINQYDDHIYSFTYPAHWGYDRMGPAYKNCNITLTNVSPGNLGANAANFVKGDEVALWNSGTAAKAWVKQVLPNGIQLIDEDGHEIGNSSNYSKITILRSGRKNQQSNPIGKIVSLESPLIDTNGDGVPDDLSFSSVIDASSTVYTEQWKQFCACGFDPASLYNPYVMGTLGNWRAQKEYLYLTERTQSTLNGNTSIRTDGTFKSFAPFWNSPSVAGNDWYKNTNNWTWTSQVTEFSPYGFEIENKDALERYSAALYGYSNKLPIAVSNNSQYKESAFDNFEDYKFYGCPDDHFSYRVYDEQVTNEESHSGRYSIKVQPLDSISVQKIINACDN